MVRQVDRTEEEAFGGRLNITQVLGLVCGGGETSVD